VRGRGNVGSLKCRKVGKVAIMARIYIYFFLFSVLQFETTSLFGDSLVNNPKSRPLFPRLTRLLLTTIKRVPIPFTAYKLNPMIPCTQGWERKGRFVGSRDQIDTRLIRMRFGAGKTAITLV